MKATTESTASLTETFSARGRGRAALAACAALLAVAPLGGGRAQQAAAAPGDRPDTTPITTLISIVAAQTDDEFVVDPRVGADVTLIGRDPADVDYEHLLAVLQVHGFAALRDGDHVSIVPQASVRSMAVPVVAGREERRAREIVSKVIAVRNVPASFVVPVMRPLIPQWGHLAAMSCSNTLIVVATFANVERLEALLESVDVGEPYEPPSCEPQTPRAGAAPAGAPPPGRRPAPNGPPAQSR